MLWRPLLLSQLDVISPCIIMETACICQWHHQVISLAACYLVLIWLSSDDVRNYLCAALAIWFESWTGQTIGKKSGNKPSHHVFTAFSVSKWLSFNRKIDLINLTATLFHLFWFMFHLCRTWLIIIVDLIPLFRWGNLVLDIKKNYGTKKQSRWL
jgi:hypothetical protein